jgi:hypothetical protein
MERARERVIPARLWPSATKDASGSVQLYALATLRRRGLDQCGVTRLDLLLRRWAEWG